MKNKVLLTLLAVGTGSLLLAQPNSPKSEEVQVRYTTDIAQNLVYSSRHMADTILSKYKDQILPQIGSEKFEEVLDGIYDQAFPCELAIFCNGLMNNTDTVSMRKASLTIYRIAEFERSKKMSIVELGNVQTTTGKKLYMLIPSKYLLPVVGKKGTPIAPRMHPRKVRILNWDGIALSTNRTDNAYWHKEPNSTDVNRFTFIVRQIGSSYASGIYSQVSRMGSIKNYLPKELVGIDSLDGATKKKRLKNVKMYFIADFNHAEEGSAENRYAILWMPYAENKTFFEGDKWQRDVFFFIEKKKIKIDK